MNKLDMLSRLRDLVSPKLWLALASCFFLNVSAFAQNDALTDPTTVSALANYSLLMDVTNVGPKLVAVGERGHILISSDNANSWQQVEHVPVRATLTAVYFSDQQWGWAVGHDGVVLRTHDGGQHWEKILDGYQANQLALKHVAQAIAQTKLSLAQTNDSERATLEAKLDALVYFGEDAESFTREGASRPFLDVWFKNANQGIIIGGFGLILHTSNGGDSWTPSFQSIENPDAFHLNKLTQIGDNLYLAGEAGTLYRSSDWGANWVLLDSPYQGSFFGVVATKSNGVLAYGLRGHAFISNDEGDNWVNVDTGIDASLFGATLLSDGTNVLVGAGGMIVYIDEQGQLINSRQSSSRLAISSVMSNVNNQLITVGLGGIEYTAALIPATVALMTTEEAAYE